MIDKGGVFKKENKCWGEDFVRILFVFFFRFFFIVGMVGILEEFIVVRTFSFWV